MRELSADELRAILLEAGFARFATPAAWPAVIAAIEAVVTKGPR